MFLRGFGAGFLPRPAPPPSESTMPADAVTPRRSRRCEFCPRILNKRHIDRVGWPHVVTPVCEACWYYRTKPNKHETRRYKVWAEAFVRAAREKATPFTVKVKYLTCPDRCPETDDELDYRASSDVAPVSWNHPVLVRIDATGGYTLGNVRVISRRAAGPEFDPAIVAKTWDDYRNGEFRSGPSVWSETSATGIPTVTATRDNGEAEF